MVTSGVVREESYESGVSDIGEKASVLSDQSDIASGKPVTDQAALMWRHLSSRQYNFPSNSAESRHLVATRAWFGYKPRRAELTRTAD